MKIIVSWIIISLFFVGIVSAYGDYANYAKPSGDMQVREQSTLASIFEPLEIGTYTTQGSFSTNFYKGETINLKFDEQPWNTKCDNAKFVIEIYDKSGFREAKYSYIGKINPSVNYVGTASYTPQSVGTWAFVDYIWCVDSSVVISKSNKIEVEVVDKTSAKCSVGWMGSQICSDGDVKRNYCNSDGSVSLKTVDDCGSSEHCYAGACLEPECVSDSQCESWQECQGQQCVAVEGKDVIKDGGGGIVVPPIDKFKVGYLLVGLLLGGGIGLIFFRSIQAALISGGVGGLLGLGIGFVI